MVTIPAIVVAVVIVIVYMKAKQIEDDNAELRREKWRREHPEDYLDG